MKIFPSTGSGQRLSSTYVDLTEHRIIPVGGEAAHDEPGTIHE
ncbi:MAG: hypothetical protein AABZ00_08905 [Chloroflexota bacterium]